MSSHRIDADQALQELQAKLLELVHCVIEARASLAATPEREPWVDLPEAARHAHCSVDVLRSLVAEEILPHGRIGRAIRVRRSDVDRLLIRGASSQEPLAPRKDSKAADILATFGIAETQGSPRGPEGD